MSRLVIYRGDERLAEHELVHGVVGLGRHPDNDIVLDDRTLSRFHARIERRDDAFVVVDLGAQNGVHKNGERIQTESELITGDRIELGKYTAVFEAAPKKKPVVKNGKSPRVEVKAPEPEPEPDLDIDLDLDLDLDDDLSDDLGGDLLDPELDDPRTNAGRDDNKTGNLSDFDAAASVEYVPPQPTFVLLFNNQQVSRHPMSPSGIVIGRSKQCDIVISLLGLSRRHAQVSLTDDGVVVEDLGSQNGTWVNNQRIEGGRVLKHGDLLNFYDYGILFLEDGDVDVGFAGAGALPPETKQQPGDLSQRNTALGDAPSTSPPRLRKPTTRSPLADVEAVAAPKPSQKVAAADTDLGLKQPQRKRNELLDDVGDDDDEDPSRFDMDLGEGSFLGDEFEAGASKERPRPTADRAKPSSTALLEGVMSRGAGDEDLEAEIAFDAAANEFGGGGVTDEVGNLADRTSAGFDVASLGGSWPTDDDLERALGLTNEACTVTLDVGMRGKPYAQIPLESNVARVGADPRCEVSLPKSAGLRPWHCTLTVFGGVVVVSRANRVGAVELAGKDIDIAVAKNFDVLKMGNVEIKLRIRRV